jgi:hypothetical protein
LIAEKNEPYTDICTPSPLSIVTGAISAPPISYITCNGREVFNFVSSLLPALASLDIDFLVGPPSKSTVKDLSSLVLNNTNVLIKFKASLSVPPSVLVFNKDLAFCGNVLYI